MKKIALILSFLIFLHGVVISADSDSTRYLSQDDFMYGNNPRYTLLGHPPFKKTEIQPIPAICFGTIATGALVSQHIIQMNTIWEEQTDFRIMEDGNYALYVDKFGHFYGSYTTSSAFTEGLYASGFSRDWAVIGGGVLGLAYESYVEIMDGYGENWGFSPSDWYADAAGAIFYVAQGYIPFLQNFSPKFMYAPPCWTGVAGRDYAQSFIDDYSSQIFWLSINVNNLLPDMAKPYWPDWLEISVGYTARSLCNGDIYPCDPIDSPHVVDNVHGRRKIIVAMDYDMVKLLPDGNTYWNWLKQSMNYVKWPAPAVEFDLEGGGAKFMLIYPFNLP